VNPILEELDASDRRLHPRYVGLRDDKRPEEVVRERAPNA